MSDDFSRREAVRWGGESLAWFVGIFLIVLIVGWGLILAALGLKVATAGLMGKGQAHIIKESAPNRIVQQAGFERAWADIKVRDVQVSDAKKTLSQWDESNLGWQTRDNAIGTLAGQRRYLMDAYTGIKQNCQNIIATYNADARSYLSEQFRAADLPFQIEPTEYCK